MVGFPFQDGIGDAVRLEPGFGAGNHFVELFGARGARQLRATLFAAHPRNGGGRIGINGHFRALLVEEGEGMDDGEKFTDVVRAVDGAEVKNLAPLGEKDAAVFHRTGISGAGGVDTERLEAHFGQDLGRGHANGADTGSRRGGRLRGSGFGTCGGTMGRDVLLGFVGRGILRFVARGEGFVTRTGKTLDLFATLVPRGVDSGDAAAPNDIELGFLATHGQEKEQKDEERCAEGGRSAKEKGRFCRNGCPTKSPLGVVRSSDAGHSSVYMRSGISMPRSSMPRRTTLATLRERTRRKLRLAASSSRRIWNSW